MSEIILYLILAFVGFYVTYFVIKKAVEHAINESLDDIEMTIRAAISKSNINCNIKNHDDKFQK